MRPMLPTGEALERNCTKHSQSQAAPKELVVQRITPNRHSLQQNIHTHKVNPNLICWRGLLRLAQAPTATSEARRQDGSKSCEAVRRHVTTWHVILYRMNCIHQTCPERNMQICQQVTRKILRKKNTLSTPSAALVLFPQTIYCWGS